MNKVLLRILFVGLISISHTMLLAEHTVTGSVKDSEGEALIGATVQVMGTSIGIICDIDGEFSIAVPDEEASLQVSYVGYVSQIVVVGNRSVVDVVLQDDIAQLDEIVVNALGFKQKGDNMGATYSKVDSKDIIRSGESTFINALSGKASGVRVSKGSGDPGAGASIQIRGANTISGGTQPLIIVDGVPLGNSSSNSFSNSVSGGTAGGTSQQSRLNDINPNDIESIQILKGASVGALWGARGANGVVVITTKKGKSGKPTIKFSSTFSVDEINRKHPLQNTFGQGSNGEWERENLSSWGDKIADRPGGPDEVDFFGEYFVAADGSVHYPITKKNSTTDYTDRNFDQVFRLGHYLQNDLSISGGNEKTTFFFSAGSLEQEGIVKNSTYDKKNVRFNSNAHLTDWLSISTKSSYVNTKSNRIQQGSNLSGMYLSLLRTAPDFNNEDHIGDYYSASGEAFLGRHRTYRNSIGQSENSGYSNPQWTTDEQTSLAIVNRFTFTPEINIDPTSWLGFTFRGGVDSYTDNRTVFFPVFSASSRSIGVYAEDVIQRNELNFDAIVRGNFELFTGLSFSPTFGWNVNDRRFTDIGSEVSNFSVNSSFPTFDLSSGNENSAIQKSSTRRRNNRGYGVLAFNFEDQLFVNLNAAAEASSTYSKTFYYPALDLAWQFNQLGLFDQVGFLSFAKLRGSWGQVGIAPGAHLSKTLVDEGVSVSSYSDGLDLALFGGGYRLDNTRGNPDLVPEIKTEYEVGIDLRLFQDRLGINFSYYQNEIVDVRLSPNLPTTTGFTSTRKNTGAMENEGIELDLNYDLIKTSDWGLNISANFNNNKNVVTDLDGVESVNLTSTAISSRAVVGYPLGALWATKAQRNDDGTLLLDANGFPSAGDAGVIGDPNPEWRGGAGLNARWKNLRLNVQFEHSQGGNFADRTRLVMYRFGTHADVGNEVTLTEDLRNMNGVLFPAGTTVRGNVDNFGAGNVLLDENWYVSKGGGFGSAVIYDLAFDNDATWTKLREVSLSYQLNNDWLKDKLKLSSVDFTATGRNLGLWTDIIGIDPETSQFGVSNGFGVEYFSNPSTRSLLFSIKVTY